MIFVNTFIQSIPRQLGTYGCIIDPESTDALVLKNLVISIQNDISGRLVNSLTSVPPFTNMV